jgi:hypothetical protein
LVHALTADGRPRDEVHFEGLEYYQVADAVHDLSADYPRSGVGPLHQILRLLPSAHPERSPLISLT